MRNPGFGTVSSAGGSGLGADQISMIRKAPKLSDSVSAIPSTRSDRPAWERLSPLARI
jgi:hypothetical protein